MVVWLLLLIVASACLFLLLRGQVERYASLCGQLAGHRKQLHAHLVAQIVAESRRVAQCIQDSIAKDASPEGQECWAQTCRTLAKGCSHVAPDTAPERLTASPPGGSATPQRGGPPSLGRRQGPGPASLE